MTAQDALLKERAALCDTFAAAGPHAPTLCEGWDTSDLAAHLLTRETRPDAIVGAFLPGPFERHLNNVMEQVKAKGYDAMIAALRAGPPALHRLGPIAAANVGENFIHHEDVRRPQGAPPRLLDAETDDILWQNLRLSALVSGRRLKGVGLTLLTPAGRRRVVKDAEPMVTITGPPGELALYMSGRKDAAAVAIDGKPEAMDIVRATKFGV